MVRVQLSSGTFAAGAAVAFFLQGCGSGSDSPTASPATTTSPPPNPVAKCMDGWAKEECCCQICPSMTAGPGFDVLSTEDCLQQGGQCKEHIEIFGPPPLGGHYVRPKPSGLAHIDVRTRSAAGGTEQHHVIGGEPDEVTIVFLQEGEKTPMTVDLRLSGASETTSTSTEPSSYSFFQNPQGWNGFSGSNRGFEYFPCAHDNGHPFYQNATCMYTSDIIHKVQLTGLTPGAAYEYQVQGEDKWRSFRMPPAVGSPISFGVTADLGQSTDAQLTMARMKESFDDGEFDAVIFPGDLSYADGYSRAWDSYGRVSEELFSAVPTAYGVGNHESTSGYENNVNFIPRYGWVSSKTTSSSALWYSFDAGLAHVIMLCSYCDTVEGSAQYVWLRNDLASVKRDVTPWVVASWHVPFYTSALTHPMETHPGSWAADGAEQREALEDLIYEAKVDVAFQGHVHSYERTEAVYKNVSTCDATVYITIGDGGNHEGPACGWVQGLPWSAMKETSFGYGVFSIKNETDAEWVWHRNQDGAKVVADRTPLKTTLNRGCPPSTGPSVPFMDITV